MRSHTSQATASLLVREVFIPAAALALCLGMAAAAPDGSVAFYGWTFAAAGLYALIWWMTRSTLAPSAQPAGGPEEGTPGTLSRIVRGGLWGGALLVLFLMGALMVRQIPVLAEPVHDLLENQRQGIVALTMATAFLNGAGEELFFRRVVPDRLSGPRWARWMISIGLYVAVTAAMGVPLLAVAAVGVGLLGHWLADTPSAGLPAAIAAHTVWTQGMLLLLPLLI